jgi:polysaccharide export outer membrane protein
MQSQSQDAREIKALNDALFSVAGTTPQPQDYIVGEGDLLQISVFEAQDLKREARVGARGTITLPLLGAVEIKGLTVREAEERIENAYRQKYLQDPHVNIFVKEQHGSKITVLGAIKNPGTYDLFARQRLLDVLATAGGLSDKAGWTVQVRRSSPDPNRPETFLIDLDQLVSKGKAELNVEIRGRDVIFIPEGGIVYVDGAVRRPGSYAVKQGMTVQQSIVAAGGFATIADEGNIKLVRYAGEGERQVLQLSMRDIHGGSDLQVHDRDVVFVETNRLEALIYGLRLNLGMGLVGIGYSPPPQ